MNNPYLTIKEIVTFTIVFAVIVLISIWIGSNGGGYEPAPPDSSWESTGF